MIRVVHCKKHPYNVYIGRPSKWGNPFSHKEGTLAQFKVASRKDAIKAFRKWFLNQPELVEQAKQELGDKVLGCWCKPLACHGDVLKEIVEQEELP